MESKTFEELYRVALGVCTPKEAHLYPNGFIVITGENSSGETVTISYRKEQEKND